MDTPAKPAPPIIMLKLDDVTRNGAHAQLPVSERWQRCVDFLQQAQVKASLGIIGSSLEEDAPPYFAWIKGLSQSGRIEFWNHCYEDRAGRFQGTSLEDQKTALEKTQRLAREKLGITLRAFGVHWSAVDATTDAALAGIPEIKVWFFGPAHPRGGQVSLQRTINLEEPTFVPNYAKVKIAYEQGYRLPYLVLQGHPNQWDENRFADFVRIVKYLQAQGCLFMTVSEYVEGARPPTPRT